MVFQLFPMVANHWSDDGMVTIHRSGLDVSNRDEVLKCQCDILFAYRCLSTMLKHQLGRKSEILKRGDTSTPLLKSVALVNLNLVKNGNKIINRSKDLLCPNIFKSAVGNPHQILKLKENHHHHNQQQHHQQQDCITKTIIL